jgi:hypothetical protein
MGQYVNDWTIKQFAAFKYNFNALIFNGVHWHIGILIN